ncbi:hypothetical protein NicSoilC12_35130 [Arthrobacter sp. NicSoilC12]|nr:hypothetical protein NicSoilC12_35130 [Arthrobacter sp. NicSoilC12]
MFFAGLFAMYFTLRSTSGLMWAEETAKLNFPFALVNTIVLVASSFTCQMGVFAAERLQPRRTGGRFSFTQWGMNGWFILTFLMGAFFVAGQATEYAMLVSEHVSLSSNAYGSAFYITTGFHGLHVIGGLIAFLLIMGRSFARRSSDTLRQLQRSSPRTTGTSWTSSGLASSWSSTSSSSQLDSFSTRGRISRSGSRSHRRIE